MKANTTVGVQIRGAEYYRQLSRAVSRFAGSGQKYTVSTTETNNSNFPLCPDAEAGCPDTFILTQPVNQNYREGMEMRDKRDE
jgi:hypothetical protein